jgi:hypothetical protein
MTRTIIRQVKWICLMSVLLVFPATASAQGDGTIIIVALLQQLNKAADLSLGFSVANSTNTPGSEREIPLGIQFGISGHRRIGAEVDLAFQSRTPDGQSLSFNMFEYLFGPRFSVGTRREMVYGHILAGGVYQWEGGSSDVASSYEGGGFAMAFGGGLDLNVNKRIAIRVAQLDWIPIRQDGTWITDTTRFGFGIVFRSGK